MGVPGELVVGGAGLARGYYNRPDLTAERFVPNPFSGTGTRLYRTGDLGRLRFRGNIEFLGRIDNQVKLRGYRIEPREVEETLLTHPSTADAIVVSRPDKTGTERLIGYVVPASGAQCCDNDFKLYLANRLPDFMVPESIILLGEVPRLPNGKIDRDALPDLQFESTRVRIAETRPLSEIELLLADIWRDVLTVEDIACSDNFFDLGGNSLSAIQVISRAQRLFGREIPITSIFDAGTLEDFAREIERSIAQDAAVNGELDALLTEIEGLPEPSPTEISNHGLEESKRHV
jgi:acyl carrier protein